MKLNITTKALETFLDQQLHSLFGLLLGANQSLTTAERKARSTQLMLTTTGAVGMLADSGLYERIHDVMESLTESWEYIETKYGTELRVGRVELVKALIHFVVENDTERLEEFGNDWVTLASGSWLA